jgi:hypothetical protein
MSNPPTRSMAYGAYQTAWVLQPAPHMRSGIGPARPTPNGWKAAQWSLDHAPAGAGPRRGCCLQIPFKLDVAALLHGARRASSNRDALLWAWARDAPQPCQIQVHTLAQSWSHRSEAQPPSEALQPPYVSARELGLGRRFHSRHELLSLLSAVRASILRGRSCPAVLLGR